MTRTTRRKAMSQHGMQVVASKLRSLVLGIAAVLCVAGVAAIAPSAAHASRTETHAARGVVKGFGPDRKFVNIAHEKIDGYMEAMTMSFEARGPDQLAGITAGDKVSFVFTANDDDGRRVLTSIKKE